MLTKESDNREDTLELKALPENQTDPVTDVEITCDAKLAVLERRFGDVYGFLVAGWTGPVDVDATSLFGRAMVLGAAHNLPTAPAGQQALETKHQLIGRVSRVIGLIWRHYSCAGVVTLPGDQPDVSV